MPWQSGVHGTGRLSGALLWLVIKRQPAPGVVFAAGAVSAIAAVDYTIAAYRRRVYMIPRRAQRAIWAARGDPASNLRE